VVAIDERRTRLHVIAGEEARVIGWLDPRHVVIGVRGPSELDIVLALAIDTGQVVRRVQVERWLPITDLAGPLEGPWLATRHGSVLDAIAPDGSRIWRESVATLERDTDEVRRWAVADGEVIGLDRSGRWWRHAVPWEVSE
jgi:hypothetical protein